MEKICILIKSSLSKLLASVDKWWTFLVITGALQLCNVVANISFNAVWILPCWVCHPCLYRPLGLFRYSLEFFPPVSKVFEHQRNSWIILNIHLVVVGRFLCSASAGPTPAHVMPSGQVFFAMGEPRHVKINCQPMVTVIDGDVQFVLGCEVLFFWWNSTVLKQSRSSKIRWELWDHTRPPLSLHVRRRKPYLSSCVVGWMDRWIDVQ